MPNKEDDFLYVFGKAANKVNYCDYFMRANKASAKKVPYAVISALHEQWDPQKKEYVQPKNKYNDVREFQENYVYRLYEYLNDCRKKKNIEKEK